MERLGGWVDCPGSGCVLLELCAKGRVGGSTGAKPPYDLLAVFSLGRIVDFMVAEGANSLSNPSKRSIPILRFSIVTLPMFGIFALAMPLIERIKQ